MSLNQSVIADPLLHYLQHVFEDASLRYLNPPKPLTGGYSSQLFTFQLETTGVLAKPFVLRVYTANLFPPGQAFREGEIQNLIYAEGYPTAPVHSICEDVTVLGHEFIIMQFMPGETMIKAYPFDQVPTELAQVHAHLHTLDMDRITQKLRLKGFYTRKQLGLFTSSFTMVLDDLESRIAARQLTYLLPALDWIQQHRSIVGKNVVVNHGDIQPMNILIDHGKISAVLDWQGWNLGEPEFDIANTMKNGLCYAPFLLPQYNWSRFIKRYVTDYHQLSQIHAEKLRYYQAVWCIRAFINISSGMPRLNNSQIRKRLFDHFNALTGIEIKEN